MTIYDLELPGGYIDDVVEDLVASTAPILINRDPEPNDLAADLDTDISLDIAVISATGVPVLASTQVYVNDVLAYDGSAGGFQTGFNGAGSSATFPQADVLRIVIDPTTLFASESIVTVRVLSASDVDPGTPLDTVYSFTTADATAPYPTAADPQDLTTVRITFSEPVLLEDASASDDALNPANWTLQRLGDYVYPVVSARVTSVARLNDRQVEVTMNIPLTPGGNYKIFVANVEDYNGNVVTAPLDFRSFVGWIPTIPTGRDFDLYQLLPTVNRAEDIDTLDLRRFIECLKEIFTLQLYDVDRFSDILDPDIAPEEWVDLMLLDLGNPFKFDLSLPDKRRLLLVLVDMYQLKGTGLGIIQVILFFLGLVVTVDAYNVDEDALVLGESELGFDWQLGPSSSFARFSFEVTSEITLTETLRDQIRDIVNYMKPGHTHFVKLNEPEVPVILDHVELGLSELGGDEWVLH